MRKLLIGYNARGKPIRVNLEQLKTSEHICGAAGSGKSKYLLHRAIQLLKLRLPFCLVDPHGSLFYDVLKYCAHYVVDREIAILNVSAPHEIVPFSPFKRAAEGDISVQVDRRVQATIHAWNVPDTDQTPTLARTLRLIYTVMLEHNLGLPQVAHLIDFDAREIRAQLIAGLLTELVQKEWEELQALRRKEWRDEILSAKNRLFRLLTSPTLARFMGLPSHSIDLADIIAKGKILLVNLAPSDYLSQENARVFGALLVNEFFETAIRRRAAYGGDPPPYFLMLDEFQNFVSIDIANALDQLRKFGMFLTLAHQRFGQLDPHIIDAVLTNCRIKVVFGGLPAESARLMAEELFIGKLDTKKIKAAIWQTKFWPRYARDRVYTNSTISASMSSQGGGSTATSFSGRGHIAMYDADSWFGHNEVGGSESLSSGSMSGQNSSWGAADSFGQSESVADIPIFIPVPFQELSSIQYYSLDEQRAELTAALKEQFPRHAFIKIHDQETQPMLVPRVPELFTPACNVSWYEQRQFSRENALSAAEADDLLASQDSALLQILSDQAVPAAAPKLRASEAPAGLIAQQPIEAAIWSREPATLHLRQVTASVQTPAKARIRKRGPKPDMETHAKVLGIVNKFGENWASEDKLSEICELLDREGVPIPKTWPTLRDRPARSWTRALEYHPDLVKKAIRYHCHTAVRSQQQFPPTFDNS